MPLNQRAFRDGVLGFIPPPAPAFRDGSLGILSGPPVSGAVKSGILGVVPEAPAFRDGVLGEYFAQNGFGVVPPAYSYRDGSLGLDAVATKPIVIASAAAAAIGLLWWKFGKKRSR